MVSKIVRRHSGMLPLLGQCEMTMTMTMTMRYDCQLLTLDEDEGHCEARQPAEQDG